jgi:hypothetical protein
MRIRLHATAPKPKAYRMVLIHFLLRRVVEFDDLFGALAKVDG